MNNGLLKLLLGLSVLLAACGGAKNLRSYPARGVPTEGGIVFKYRSVQDAPNWRPEIIGFKIIPKGAKKTYGVYQKEGKGGLYPDLGAEVEETVLLAAPAGEYYMQIYTGIEARGLGNSQVVRFHLDDPGGSFASIKVEPGRVVSLGKLDLLFKLEDLGDSVTWKNSKASWDDREATRKVVAREALEDGRAQKMKWDEALDASLN